MIKNNSKLQLVRGIYLLPNLFTTASLFAAFYAIVAAMKGAFEPAAIAIYVAMLCDSLDGRIARLTKTESEFGAQYDSLSDLVAFGLAPALVIYSWSLHNLGKPGWLIAFFYTACTALRLARFNTQLGSADKRYFQGLSCTSSAGVLAGVVWLGYDFADLATIPSWVVAVLTVALSASMVSNTRYHSFKQIEFKGRVSFMAIIALVLVFIGISIKPPLVLFAVFFSYALSGPVLTLYYRHQKRQLRRRRGKAK
jgi:CDP-diacylglycerol--serine O-phosphatidyltransferase